MGIRDCWVTPKPVARRIPLVDLDPCSNPRSHIKSRRSCMLERGENGLLVDWTGLSVFVNPPFSNVDDFAAKAIEAAHTLFLVNVDVSTKWYDVLTMWPDTYEFHFKKRIGFDAPPSIDESQNNSSQMFICDEWFYQQLKSPFLGWGKWFKKV